MYLRKDTEQAVGRVRLQGTQTRRGSKTGLPTWGMFLFGGTFAVASMSIMLMGLKVIHVNPRSVHAPYWIITILGFVFLMAAFALWAMMYKQYQSERRKQRGLQEHPGEKALMDYDWNIHGFSSTAWKKTISSFLFGGFLTMFLSGFNYWAFVKGGGIFVTIIVSIFDLILILVWWQFFIMLGRAIKFGNSRIFFDRFPYSLSKPISIRWLPPSGINPPKNPSSKNGTIKPLGSFTLRCVEEWFESSGSGNNRQQSMVHEELWREKWLIENTMTGTLPLSLQAGQETIIRFELGQNALSTNLSGDKPVFWEFEVNFDLPGFDFQEVYLVPIYGKNINSKL